MNHCQACKDEHLKIDRRFWCACPCMSCQELRTWRAENGRRGVAIRERMKREAMR